MAKKTRTPNVRSVTNLISSKNGSNSTQMWSSVLFIVSLDGYSFLNSFVAVRKNELDDTLFLSDNRAVNGVDMITYSRWVFMLFYSL